MSAEDQPVMVPGGRISRGMDIALSEPAQRIELRYKLGGITIRSIPSRAGRALSAISPLVANVPEVPVAITVSGSTVLNIECPVPSSRDRACAMGRPPNLRVERYLPSASAVIVVQFDLPRPQ